MPATIVIVTGAILITIVSAVVVALSRHKKAGAGDIKLVGEFAMVQTKLNPEGTVIVRGELWRARSDDSEAVSAGARVRVVGFRDHLALVEAEPDKL